MNGLRIKGWETFGMGSMNRRLHKNRSGQVRVTMSTVQSHGHRGQSFASWRFGVFALSDRTALLEQRYEKACGGRGGDAGFSGGLEVSFLTRRRKGAKETFMNQAAPAKPAGASLFDSQPIERGLADPQR